MELRVTDEHDGIRLDRLCRELLPRLPVSAFYRLLRKRKIRVNGRPEKEADRTLRSGDVVRVEEDSRERSASSRPGRPPAVLFEDAAFIVIDKPRGLAVHPGKGDSGRTVIDDLRSAAVGYEPFLVHRLDKYTSGAMLVAKDRETAGRLGDLLRGESGGGGSRRLRKVYLAVAFGSPERAGRVDLSLDGKPALTRYRSLQEIPWGGAALSLLEVEIDTGRTHQIRRHLAAVHLPLAGDDEYGDWDLNKRFRAEFGIRHYLLHSREIRIDHPVTGVPLTFTAPIPREFFLLFKGLPAGSP